MAVMKSKTRFVCVDCHRQSFWTTITLAWDVSPEKPIVTNFILVEININFYGITLKMQNFTICIFKNSVWIIVSCVKMVKLNSSQLPLRNLFSFITSTQLYFLFIILLPLKNIFNNSCNTIQLNYKYMYASMVICNECYEAAYLSLYLRYSSVSLSSDSLE